MKWSRLLEAKSANRITSFGCLASSSFIIESSNPFTILTENFLSRRWKVFVRIAAEVMPSVSWWDMILTGLFLENSRNSSAKVSISFSIEVRNLF